MTPPPSVETELDLLGMTSNNGRVGMRVPRSHMSYVFKSTIGYTQEVTESRSLKTSNSSWVRFRRWTIIAIPVVDDVRFAYSGEQAGASIATREVGLDESWVEHPQPGQRPRRGFSTSIGLVLVRVSDASSRIVPQKAQADMPDIQFLQAVIDRAHEKQSRASKGTSRLIFPGVNEEVLGWVLEESEGQSERSIEASLEIASGG